MKKKNETDDKAVRPAPENKSGEMVTVRVLPLRGIGGVGGPGTVTQMEKSLAEQYARDGYVEIIKEKE